MAPRCRRRADGWPALVWTLEPPRVAIASTVLGGGIGPCRFVVNAQVPPDFATADAGTYLHRAAAELGCEENVVGFLTAAAVDAVATGTDGGVEAYATVGLNHPSWAAATAATSAPIGTINVVAAVPARLSEGALVNAVMTVTEAKVQALQDAGVSASGTPTDAVCVLAECDGPNEPYGGPRSRWGSRLARAVHEAVLAGARADLRDAGVP